MDYKVLYRKYRPEDFDNIIDQDVIINTLKNAIKKGKIAHAYIFSGPRGTGKTTTAKVFAKAINCEKYQDGPCNKCESCKNINSSADIIEIDAASNNGVDNVRELINNVKLAPSSSKYKVYIIDEVHMLTTSAFNALLLTLEEPPSNVVFILATTNIENVPITILSRCQRFDFNQISKSALKDRLKYVIKNENIKISDEAIDEICILAEGGMRDALGILDQLSSQFEKIEIDDVQKTYNIVGNQIIDNLINAFFNSNSKDISNLFNTIKTKSYNFNTFAKRLIDAFHKYLLVNIDNVDRTLIKKVVLEINSLVSNVNIYINSYTLLETILMSYISTIGTSENKSDNNLQIVDDTNINPEIKEKNEINNYFPGNIDSFKSVRINNCFVEPKKQLLKEHNNQWQEFIKELKDKKLLSLLVDSSLVVCGEKYCMISTEIEATSHLINTCIENIEGLFNKKYNTSLKLISVSNSEWNSLKEEYINNLHKKHKYEFVEEVKKEYNNDDFKNILNDVFENDKIEME